MAVAEVRDSGLAPVMLVRARAVLLEMRASWGGSAPCSSVLEMRLICSSTAATFLSSTLVSTVPWYSPAMSLSLTLKASRRLTMAMVRACGGCHNAGWHNVMQGAHDMVITWEPLRVNY
jgi:hypothetical protein